MDIKHGSCNWAEKSWVRECTLPGRCVVPYDGWCLPSTESGVNGVRWPAAPRIWPCVLSRVDRSIYNAVDTKKGHIVQSLHLGKTELRAAQSSLNNALPIFPAGDTRKPSRAA